MNADARSPWIRVFREVWDEIMEIPGAKLMEPGDRVYMSGIIINQLHATTDSYLAQFDARRVGERIIPTEPTDGRSEWTEDAEAELERRLREFDPQHLISEWILDPKNDSSEKKE